MKLLKPAIAVIISTSLLSSNTFAHASYKNEAMPAAVTLTAPHNWSGFYAGFNVGAVNHTMNITDTQATTFNATIEQVSNPQFTGGLQVGYRRQLDLAQTSGVYGAEFDANFSNTTYNKNYGSPFALYQLSSSNTLNTVCLLELTGGIAADRTLLFLAAGLSWSNLSGSTTNTSTIPFFNSFSMDKKAIGTAIGGGVEYAYNEKTSIRFKVDYITPNTYSTQDNTDDSFQISNTIIQGTLGINYKFA